MLFFCIARVFPLLIILVIVVGMTPMLVAMNIVIGFYCYGQDFNIESVGSNLRRSHYSSIRHVLALSVIS